MIDYAGSGVSTERGQRPQDGGGRGEPIATKVGMDVPMDTVADAYIPGQDVDDVSFDVAEKVLDGKCISLRPNVAYKFADTIRMEKREKPGKSTVTTTSLTNNSALKRDYGKIFRWMEDEDLVDPAETGRSRYNMPENESLTAIETASDLYFACSWECFLQYIDDPREQYLESDIQEHIHPETRYNRSYKIVGSRDGENHVFYTGDNGRELELLERTPDTSPFDTASR